MATRIRVPSGYKTTLERFVRLPPSARKKILAAMKDAQPKLTLADLAEDLAGKAEMAAKELTDLLEMLSSLFSNTERHGLAISSIPGLLRDAVDREGIEPKLTDADWEGLAADLKALFSLDRPFLVSAKALDVLGDHDRVLHHSRIITDIRPIFPQRIELGPAAAVVVHNLSLSVMQDGDFKSIHVAMDSEDLRELKKVVERALAKEGTLSKALSEGKLELLRE